jgi:hypothetical protein
MAVQLPAYRKILGSKHYPWFMHRLVKIHCIHRRNEYSYRQCYSTSTHIHATKGPAPQVGENWVDFSGNDRRIVSTHPNKSGDRSADVRNSVLIISIIRLKTTVDMASHPDITWEFVRNGIWWLVHINFMPEPEKDMSNASIFRMIEMHLAIICASLPVGKAFLRKHFPSVVDYTFNASA